MGPDMKRKFTLVELLVVIAIIALLASLLLPSLSRAKDYAKSLSCLNSVKMLSLGAISYSDSYGGWSLPYAYGWTGSAYPVKYMGPSSDLYKSFVELLNVPRSVVNSGNYGAATKAYICPLACGIWNWNTTLLGSNPVYATSPPSYNFTYSYGLNMNILGGYGAEPCAIKMSKVKSPSHIALFLESTDSSPARSGSTYSGYLANTQEKHGSPVSTAYRHAKGANVGFFDGHAMKMNYKDFQNNSYYWENN